MYKKVLPRYLYFVREAKKYLRDDISTNDVINKNEDEQNENMSLNNGEDDLTETQILISDAGAITIVLEKNRSIGRNDQRNTWTIKRSQGEIAII